MNQNEQTSVLAQAFSITNFDLPSLHLLHNEIVVILKDTEMHLSEFNDDPSQAPLLLDSIDVLTQLSCIFEMIALKGGHLLSQAITKSLQQLYDSGDNNDTALIMDISEAIMTLDRYVEFVLLTETVAPTLLLPILNKLSAHQGHAPISEADFADFGSSSVIIANPEKNFKPLDKLDVDKEMLARAYRSGLTVAISAKSASVSATDQQKIDAMSAACTWIAAHNDSLFWQAAAAAVTDIKSALPLTTGQKHTLIYLEQQFHSYLPINDARFADLVSFACGRDNAQAKRLRTQYAANQLDEAQRKQMQRFLFGPNRAVTDTLNDLIQHDINNIKEKVDSYARDESLNPREVQAAQIAENLSELASALRLLNLNDASASLSQAAAAVAQWQAPNPDDFDQLLLALMSAENAIIAMAEMHTPGAVCLPLHNRDISLHQLNTAHDTLVQESRMVISSAEQAINDYLADSESERDLSNLQNIPAMMRQVSGAVRFLQLPGAASMLSQLANVIDQRLTGSAIHEDHLACVADVMMAVDYRLDGFENNRPVNNRSLDIGQHSLSQLLAA